MPGEFSPYLVATPLVTLVFACYGRVMPFGALGYVGGSLAGFVWSLVAGVVSSWLSQNATTAALSADAVLFACVIVAGSLVGGGQANCARPWPTDQFSFAASRTVTNTSSGRMPGLSPSSSAIRRNNALFCSAVRVLNTVIWM